MEIEVEGKTVEEAIKEGLRKLGCAKEDVEIKILNEGSSGLFGLMGTKPACVQLICKNGAPRINTNADVVLTQKRAKEVLGDILKLMNISFKEINTALMTGRIYAEIKSDDSRFLIGKNGNTLDALEHVLNLILHKDEKTRAKVDLDVEGYRKQQEDRLHSLTMKAVSQVRKSGKAFRFDPMPSGERRLIHLFIKTMPDIEAFSEGEGNFRKVILKPKKKS